MDGKAKVLICNVGENSVNGKIRKTLMNTEAEPTALQEKLESLAETIGIYGTWLAVVTLIVLVAHIAYNVCS